MGDSIVVARHSRLKAVVVVHRYKNKGRRCSILLLQLTAKLAAMSVRPFMYFLYLCVASEITDCLILIIIYNMLYIITNGMPVKIVTSSEANTALDISHSL